MKNQAGGAGTAKVAGSPSQVVLNDKEKRQRGRIYNRLVSGMYCHRAEDFRFLTLTSSPKSGNIRQHWGQLVTLIRKTTPAAIAQAGYQLDLDKHRSWVEPLAFEYCAVFTTEGHGVIHAVYAGDYIPFPWLQDQWSRLHQAYGVNIRKVRPYSRKKAKGREPATEAKVYNPSGLASYMLQRYLGDQAQVRWVNYSRGWLYPGYSSDWKAFKKACGVKQHNMSRSDWKPVVAAWHRYLDAYHQPQAQLDGEVIRPRPRDFAVGHSAEKVGHRQQNANMTLSKLRSDKNI